jgi:hypothetical protein
VPLAEPPADLSGFPDWTLRPDQMLTRIHGVANDPRFFSSSGEGRFDLGSPRGTLYTAETPVGSFIEVFRAVLFVPQAEVDVRLLARIRVPNERRLADCTSSRARRLGVTAAIHSTPDYALCERWAEAFAAARFAGIRYRVSHDPSTTEIGLALFGDEGVDLSLDVDADGPIPPGVVAELRKRFGILVLPTPS